MATPQKNRAGQPKPKAKPKTKAKYSNFSRPKKLNERIIKMFCDSILDTPGGGPLELHAQCVGVHPTTVCEWQQKGREAPRSMYGKFLGAIENAYAKSWQKLHKMAAYRVPQEVLFRRWASHYPPQAQQLELSGQAAIVPTVQIVFAQVVSPAETAMEMQFAPEPSLVVLPQAESQSQSVQPDPEYVAALEKKLADIQARNAATQAQVHAEVSGRLSQVLTSRSNGPSSPKIHQRPSAR